MLAALRRHLGMPLLTKELAEQAARKRTYLIRFVYTAVLFGVGCSSFMTGSAGNSDLLGQGQEMFYQVFHLQLAAILLVLPALCAGAFAGEKERESLSLLLLTTIPSPLIVLQKLLSRVIPMLAFRHTVVSADGDRLQLWRRADDPLVATLTFLVMLTIFVGSVSIMSSTYCRTTVEAYVMTYVCLLASWPLVRNSLPSANAYRFCGVDLGRVDSGLDLACGGFHGPSHLCGPALRQQFFVPTGVCASQELPAVDLQEAGRVLQRMNVVTGA